MLSVVEVFNPRTIGPVSRSQVLLHFLVQKDLGVVVSATSLEKQRESLDVYRHGIRLPPREMHVLECLANNNKYDENNKNGNCEYDSDDNESDEHQLM